MTAVRAAELAVTDVPPAALAELTRSEVKRDAYRVDPYFRHGLRAIPVPLALASTFVVLKPDAVAGRRLGVVLDAVRDNEFSVLDARTFTFTPLLTREVWRYQFNIASWARAEVVDLLLPSGESLLLTLRDERYAPGLLPAACRLAALKGPADPRLRRPDDLRSLLRAPTTLFNFVHTADEPADVVRELALLELATGAPASRVPDQPVAPAELAALLQRLHRAQPEHDLDETASWRRLAALPGGPVAELADRALNGDPAADWSALLGLFPARRPPRALLWDVLAIATAQIDCNVPGLRPVVPTIGARAWLPGEGELS